MSNFVLGDGAEGQRRFEELLAVRFPAIAAQISEIEQGLLHPEMGAFARATCAAIDRADFKEVSAHFAFVDELFQNAPPDLENAIYVSYLENVFVGRNDQPYRASRSALSERLQAALIDLEEHWKNIAAWHRERNSDT